MAFKIAHQRFILRLIYSSNMTTGAVRSLTEGVNTPLALQGRAKFAQPTGGKSKMFIFGIGRRSALTKKH